MASAVKNPGESGLASSAAAAPQRLDELLPLARAAAARDSAAAASLVVHVAPLMLKVVRSVLGSRHADVEDVAQDAVIQLLASLPAFRGESTVLYYAGRVALFTALASRRKEEKRVWRLDDGDALAEQTPDHGSASPLGEVIARRQREILLGLLEELPKPTAEALGLHFVLGYTVDEIAKSAQISPHTVWSRLRLGKEALLRRLARDRRLAELQRGVP